MKKIILFGMAILLLCPLVSAFGVTAPYWSSNPLVLAPGESKDVSLLLQNMIGDKDVTLMAELVDGDGVASVTDSNLKYLIPFGTKDTKVNLNIRVPEGASEGTKYFVTLGFKQVTESSGEMVQMASGLQKTIPVVVQEPVVESPVETTPANQSYSPVVFAMLLLAVLIVVYLYIRQK